MTAAMELIAVVTTVADTAQAERLATAAVERRVAACVQTEPIRSTYSWEGAVAREAEVRLLFKTTRDRYADLERLLLALHPYQVPAIFALPVTDASAAYAQWVCDAVASPP